MRFIDAIGNGRSPKIEGLVSYKDYIFIATSDGVYGFNPTSNSLQEVDFKKP